MIKWEGFTFIIFLLTLTAILIYIYYQDYKKTKTLQAFFASLTHELKTPLASIQLQGQVLRESLAEAQLPTRLHDKIKKYTSRLINDGIRLEDQLDNHLQLSRVERKAPLNLTRTNLADFIKREQKRYISDMDLQVNILDNSSSNVYADDFALQTIFRNLFENTLAHITGPQKVVTITIADSKDKVQLTYQDNGAEFSGQVTKLGTLFYKHNSPKGSGIGLYLIKKLMSKMKGKLIISQNDSNQLTINLLFRAGETHAC